MRCGCVTLAGPTSDCEGDGNRIRGCSPESRSVFTTVEVSRHQNNHVKKRMAGVSLIYNGRQRQYMLPCIREPPKGYKVRRTRRPNLDVTMHFRDYYSRRFRPQAW
jgi:hypothetical protein